VPEAICRRHTGKAKHLEEVAMEFNGALLAALIPLFLIQIGLLVWAIFDLVKRARVRGGSKVIWVLVILFVNIIGPIIYLAWGREE
jgi:hypothetical protein